MSNRLKKILLLAGLSFVVIIIAILLYRIFFASVVPTPPGSNTNGNAGVPLPGAGTNANIPIAGQGGALPPGSIVTPPSIPQPPSGVGITTSPIANGGLTDIKQLTQTASIGAGVGADGNSIVYYNRADGKFYRATADGASALLSEKTFFEVDSVAWAPDRRKAILEYPDGANIVFDFTAQKQVTLPQHWQEFDFSPQSDQIIFKNMANDPENRWLAVAKSDGSQAQKIEHMGDNAGSVQTNWSPNNQVVATYIGPKDGNHQELFPIGLNGENFKSTIVDGRGFVGQWSTNGDTMLYSVYSQTTDNNPTLWIMSAQGDAIGRGRRNLGIQTWADKCSFADNTSVYCAVPRELRPGAGIFRDDLDINPTDIYKIDLTTGFKTLVAIPVQDHNIGKIMTSDDGQYLYFSSKTDGNIYQMRLR